MMLHRDGSTHDWLGTGVKLDLIVTMDDAGSEIFSAFLVAQEGTVSTLQGLIDVVGEHGLPCSLYTDRGSHYWLARAAGGKVDKLNLTQAGRALQQLGIEHIPAYSACGARAFWARLRHAAGPAGQGTGVGRDQRCCQMARWRSSTGRDAWRIISRTAA